MSFADAANAYGNYMANRSPLGAAMYQGITGKAPTAPQGQNPAVALANAAIARYRSGKNQGNGAPGAPQQDQSSQPIPQAQPMQAPPADLGDGDMSNPAAQQQSQWNQPSQQQNPTLMNSILKKPDNGSGSASGSPEEDMGTEGMGSDIADMSDSGIGGMARGGIAPQNMNARVAESGPEVAGGKIITSPSIVSLNKGDSVVPLTPRAGNKLQPDLLEGHIAAPRAQGLNYSRFQRYGQGRGLMK